MEIHFFFSVQLLMGVYICIQFHENIPDGINKENNFTKIVELQFLFSAHCLILVYFCTQFHRNILDRF